MRLLALAFLACTGCITQRVVPSPGVPFPIPPSKVAGVGNVVFDMSGGRKAIVSALQGAGREAKWVELCTTPCAVTLKPGRYTLDFTDVTDTHLTGTTDVVVPPSEKILVRHAVGYWRPMPSGIGFAGIMLGSVGLVGGFIGLVSAAGSSSNTRPGDISPAVGATMLVLGSLMVGGAVVLLHFCRGERQEGATSITPL